MMAELTSAEYRTQGSTPHRCRQVRVWRSRQMVLGIVSLALFASGM
jgi:hypothetical protein